MFKGNFNSIDSWDLKFTLIEFFSKDSLMKNVISFIFCKLVSDINCSNILLNVK